MAQATNRQILLVEKPTGKLGPQHFKMSESAVPEPKDGEVLLRVLYISLDAANRAWMQGATYRSAVEANSVMAGGGLAEVVASKAAGFAPGDLVFGDTGWQDFAAVPAKHLVKVPRMEPLTHLLSVFGIAGLTAYFGLLNVGKPKSGETVVVSAAAGSVGSIVGQIAKIKECRVIGVAGGKDKCNWLTSELGFDAAVDYKNEAVFKALKAAAPKRHRCLFRQCRRRYSRSLPAANEFAWPHRLLWRDLAIRRRPLRDRAARHSRLDRRQAPDHAGLHRDGLLRSARSGADRPAILGESRPAQGTGRRHQRPRKHAAGADRTSWPGKIAASAWSKCRHDRKRPDFKLLLLLWPGVFVFCHTRPFWPTQAHSSPLLTS